MDKNKLLTLYNTSMQIAEGVATKGETLTETDKSCIIDSVGALLEALGIGKFNGVYSIEQLKLDIKEV